MSDVTPLLRTEAFKGKTLIAHYCEGFDFQLLYEDMYSYASVVQGKLDPPIMKGNKIMEGKLYNDITLIDSFNYMMTGLSEIPKMSAFEELAKGYFPHKFNLPQFQNYAGPIPAVDYYFEYLEKKEGAKTSFWLGMQNRSPIVCCTIFTTR